jgi:hypothetical protein
MDPLKKATRPATDYMGRGSDPGNVPVARGQKLAQQFYTQPGARVPNNTMVGNQIQQELAASDNARISSNLYGDWRAQNLPGTGVTYGMQAPAWGAGRAMAPQGMPETEGLGDLRWAGQVNGAGGPLMGPPNEWVANPGLAKETARYPDTGQPMGLPLPASPPMGLEDLASSQSLMPAAPDMMFASRVEGHPAEAALPAAGFGATPTQGGMPPAMPQPKEA